MARISVVIPTYNRSALLERALASVQRQSFRDFEVIVADDASTDGTPEIVRNYRDIPIIYHRREVNGGNAAARNDGVRLVTSPLVSFLDSDDELLPDFLGETLSAIENTPDEIGFCWGSKIVRDDATGKESRVLWNPPSSYSYEDFLRYQNTGLGSGLTIKRACFDSVGMFDESLRGAVDREFLVRLRKGYAFKVFEGCQYVQHVHGSERVSNDLRSKAFAHDVMNRRHIDAISANPDLAREWWYKCMLLQYHARNVRLGDEYFARLRSRNLLTFRAILVFAVAHTFPAMLSKRNHDIVSRIVKMGRESRR